MGIEDDELGIKSVSFFLTMVNVRHITKDHNQEIRSREYISNKISWHNGIWVSSKKWCSKN